MNYWAIFAADLDDGAMLLDLPDDGPASYKYSLGKPLTEGYPNQEEAIMMLDPDYEDQIKLYDFVNNTDDALIVNKKTKTIINSLQKNNIEFLPITIWDHYKKVLSTDYFITNSLVALPIIDMEKSNYVMNNLDKNQISRIKNFIVNRECENKAQHLFRANTMLDLLIISDEMKILLETNNITGYKLFKLDNWDGLPI